MGAKPHTRERVLAVERILEFSDKPLTVPTIDTVHHVEQVSSTQSLKPDIMTTKGKLQRYNGIKIGANRSGVRCTTFYTVG